MNLMPEPEGLDLRKFLDKSTSKTSLSDLQKKGVSSVKVLDERTLHRLIQEAVTRIIAGRPELLTEAERQKIYDDSRKELDRLIREYTTMKKQNEAVSQDRNTLIAELENLQKQLEVTRRMYEEKLRQKESEAQNSGRVKELEATVAQMRVKEEYLQEQLKYVQENAAQPTKVKELENEVVHLRAKMEVQEKELEQSDRKFQEGVASQQPYIQELKARIQTQEEQLEKSRSMVEQGVFNQKLEELAKKDDVVADKLARLFNRTIEGLSRKIAALKPGGLEEEIEYKPNEMVLENLLKQELESNLGTVSVKEVSAKGKGGTEGNVDERLAKLKAIREGIAKPRSEEKRDSG
jgi:myosin heavy subunit